MTCDIKAVDLSSIDTSDGGSSTPTSGASTGIPSRPDSPQIQATVVDPETIVASVGGTLSKVTNTIGRLRAQLNAATATISAKDAIIAELRGQVAALEKAQGAYTKALPGINFNTPLLAANPNKLEEAIKSPQLRAVINGDASVYLWRGRETIHSQATHLLKSLMDEKPQDEKTVRAIYNLLHFVSEWNIDKSLRHNIRDWILSRATDNPPFAWEKDKRQTLLHALSTKFNHLPEDLMKSLALVEGFYALKPSVSVDSLHKLMLKTDRTGVEEYFLSTFLAALKTAYPNDFETLEQFIIKGSQITPLLSLQREPTVPEQERTNRENGSKITQLLKGLKAGIPEPLAAHDDHVVIASPTLPDDRFIVPIQAAFQKGLRLDDRQDLLGKIDGQLSANLETLSGLNIQNSSEFAAELYQAWIENRLPKFFQNLFFQGMGEQAKNIAQLLYYRGAILAFKVKEFPPAPLSQWEGFLFRGTPLDASAQTMALIRTSEQQGSFLTSFQISWVKAACSSGSKPINSPPGTGKSFTAIFTLILRKELGEAADAEGLIVSPAAHMIKRLKSYQLPLGQKHIELPGKKGMTVFLDEEHTVDPETLFTIDGSKTDVTAITATPYRRDLGEDDFRDEQLFQLRTRLQSLSRRAAELERQKTTQVTEGKRRELEGLRAAIGESLPMFTNYLFLLNYDNLVNQPIIDIQMKLRLLDIYFEKVSVKDIRSRIAALKLFLNSKDLQASLTSITDRNRLPNYLIKNPDRLDAMKKLAKTSRDDALRFLTQVEERLSRYEVVSNPKFTLPFDPTIQAEIDLLKKEQDALKLKIARMTRRTEIESATTSYGKYVQELAARKADALAGVEYVHDESITGFDAEKVATSLKDRPLEPIVQLIFPTDVLDDHKLDKLRAALGQAVIIYHDSHSVENRGHDMVIMLDGTRARLADTKDLGGKWVLVYDQTNMQGGDFGDRSFARHPNHNLGISQFIYCGNDEKLTTHDVYQALSRRRGDLSSQPKSVIFGPALSREEFYSDAEKAQMKAEKRSTENYIVKRITRKLAKLFEMNEGADSTSLEDLAAKVKANLPKLEAAFPTLLQRSENWKHQKLVNSILHFAAQATI